MTTAARPGITHLGQVYDDGHTVTISGWGLSQCAAQCHCHRDDSGRLAILDSDDGTLGLVADPDCSCCSPWLVSELVAVLQDMHDVGAVEAAG